MKIDHFTAEVTGVATRQALYLHPDFDPTTGQKAVSNYIMITTDGVRVVVTLTVQEQTAHDAAMAEDARAKRALEVLLQSGLPRRAPDGLLPEERIGRVESQEGLPWDQRRYRKD